MAGNNHLLARLERNFAKSKNWFMVAITQIKSIKMEIISAYQKM